MKFQTFTLINNFILFVSSQKDVEEIVSANNRFVSSIYKEIVKNEKGNFLVSPFSAETVIALTQSGAKDETAEEIRSALHLPDNQEKIESGFKKLLSSLKSVKNPVLKTANKLYIKQNFTIKTEFKKIATDVFYSESQNIDFLKKTSVLEMNNWVEENTENKIHNLIAPNDISDATVLILINALYFQGNWTLPFDEKLTKKQNFYKTTKNVIQVDTMRRSDKSFNYAESVELDAKFLELAFKGDDVSMTFVLPKKVNGLSALEKQIEKVFISPQYKKTVVNVTLPKFKLESKTDFKEILEHLGVSKAFSFKEADLSGIAGRKGDLKIGKIIQKSFIDVNEGGVEAAAATFVEVVIESSVLIQKDFIADHPFIFYIKIKGVIIFAGRVGLPV